MAFPRRTGAGCVRRFCRDRNLARFRKPLPVFVHRPHCQQNMRVRIAVAFVVNRKVRDHAAGDKLLPAVIADQGFIFVFGQFYWQRHDDSPRKLGVPLSFDLLGGIPQCLTVCVFRRSIGWKENAFCQDLAGFIAVVFLSSSRTQLKNFSGRSDRAAPGNGGLRLLLCRIEIEKCGHAIMNYLHSHKSRFATLKQGSRNGAGACPVDWSLRESNNLVNARAPGNRCIIAPSFIESHPRCLLFRRFGSSPLGARQRQADGTP